MPIDLSENERALAKLAAAGGGSSQPMMSVDPGVSAVPASSGPVSSEPMVSYSPAGPVASTVPIVPPAGPGSDPNDTSWVKGAMVPQAGALPPIIANAAEKPNNVTSPSDLKKAFGSDAYKTPISGDTKNPNGFDFGKHMSDSLNMGKVAPIDPSSQASVANNEAGQGATPGRTGSDTAPMMFANPAPKRAASGGSFGGSSGGSSSASNPREDFYKSVMDIAHARNNELADQARFGDEAAKALEDKRVRLEAFNNKQKENEDRRQAEWADANAKVDEAQKEANNFDVHDGGFLGRNPGAILTAIGAIFGGALSARTGQPNQAMNALDAMINRDIQAQKDRLAQKKDKVSGYINSLGRMRELFKDERAAELVEEASIRSNINDKIEVITQSSKNEQLRDQGQTILQEGRAKVAQLKYEAAQREAAAAAARAAQERATQLEFTKMAVQHAYKMAEEGPVKFDKEQQKLKETYVPGYGFAANPEQASKLKAATTIQDMVSKQIPELVKEYEDLGVTGRAANINGRADALKQRLGGLIAAVKNDITKTGSSMTESEARLIGATPDDVGDWFNVRGVATGKLNTFKQMVSDNVAAQLKNASIERGRVVENVPNPFTGERMPYYMKSGTVLGDIPKVPDIGTKETK